MALFPIDARDDGVRASSSRSNADAAPDAWLRMNSFRASANDAPADGDVADARLTLVADVPFASPCRTALAVGGLGVFATKAIPEFVAACAKRGVELKWFGDDEPKAFTSRYDSWRYIDDIPVLPTTLRVLEKTLDMRVPLTFTIDDCDMIASIIEDEIQTFLPV